MAKIDPVNVASKQKTNPKDAAATARSSSSGLRFLRYLIEKIIDIAKARTDPGEWHELKPADLESDCLAGIVIKAHEALIDADERNEAAFGRVVEGFRAYRKTDEDAGPPST